jgi:hypothetical protein
MRRAPAAIATEAVEIGRGFSAGTHGRDECFGIALVPWRRFRLLCASAVA